MDRMSNRNTASTAQETCNQRTLIRLVMIWGVFASLVLGSVAYAGEFSENIDGDIGLGVYYTSSLIRSQASQKPVLPYAYFSYDRAFVRLDTLGVKTMKMGYGYLEIVGRYSQDGFDSDTAALAGIENRRTSVPLGVGTLQVTPIGAFFINAFHDVGKSGGNLLEAIYVAKLESLGAAFYPMLGAEHRSREYVSYYYGVSSQEAAGSSFPEYHPGGAFNPLLGMMVEVGLTDEYHLNFYLRRRWLDSAIHASPLVKRRHLDTGFVALSYRFK